MTGAESEAGPGEGLRPDAASIGHVILFADGFVDLGPCIDGDREIAIRIKTGRWNTNGSEDDALGGLKRRCGNVRRPSRGKPHSGHRRRCGPLALILDDDPQLGDT